MTLKSERSSLQPTPSQVIAGTGQMCSGQTAANTTRPSNLPPLLPSDQPAPPNPQMSSWTTWSTTACVNTKKWTVADEDVLLIPKPPKNPKKVSSTSLSLPFD